MQDIPFTSARNAVPRGRKAGLLAMFALAFAGLCSAADAQAANPLSTCFWAGPFSTVTPTALGEDGKRFLFPEERATYWMGRYNTLPEGAHISLTRNFAYARHESLNAYKSVMDGNIPRKGSPSDAIADYEIVPHAGSTNPYILGNARDGAKRLYTVKVMPVAPPADPAARAANTLYAGAGENGTSEILLRVYAPDVESDLLGGTALPEPKLHLKDGSVLTGQAVCKAISAEDQSMPKPLLTQEQWESPMALGSAANTANCPNARGASPKLTWHRLFGAANTLSLLRNCGVDPDPTATQQVNIGFYGTLHNSYIVATMHQNYGKLVVLTGKAPSFRKTSTKQKKVDSTPTQLRYWSICTITGFSTTYTATGACKADYQIPVDSKGNYTVVISRPADRPANATTQCGVTWLNWWDQGDGNADPSAAPANPGFGMVGVRQLITDSGFKQGIKNITRNADVESTMGEYYPKPQYVATKEDFESRGCINAAKR